MQCGGTGSPSRLCPTLLCDCVCPFPSVCPSFLLCKWKRLKLMVSNILATLPGSSFFDFHESTFFSHFKTQIPILLLWEGMRLAGDPQRFTCPSRAVIAFQSADAASGPLGLQSSTHRTGSHWHFQSDLERGRGQWWRCAQPLHTGLGAGSRGRWAMRGEQRETEREGGSECFILPWSSPRLRGRKQSRKREVTGNACPPEMGSSYLVGDVIPRLELLPHAVHG